MSYKIYTKKLADNKIESLLYEVVMLNEAYDRHQKNNGSNDFALQSLILESFLLHARILIDFLEDKESKQNDDLTCSDFVDNDNNAINGQIVNLKPDIKKVLNKHLAHLTKVRSAQKPVWNMHEIKLAINDSIRNFINECADSNFPNDPKMWRLAFYEQLDK